MSWRGKGTLSLYQIVHTTESMFLIVELSITVSKMGLETYFFLMTSRMTLITCYAKLNFYFSTLRSLLPGRQGRKSMFKHGRDNVGVKYTSRLRDVAPCFVRRVWGHSPPPPENFFKWCNLVRFGVY